MYRFAARPAQSPTPLDLPCRLSDPRSNQRPLYNHTTPEPLEDQCWWRADKWAERFGKSTREQIGALPPPYGRQLAPTRLNSARIPASSPLLGCKTRLSFVVPSEPLHRSTQAFCRSSKCCSGVLLGRQGRYPAPLADKSCAHHDYHLLARGPDSVFGYLTVCD